MSVRERGYTAVLLHRGYEHREVHRLQRHANPWQEIHTNTFEPLNVRATEAPDPTAPLNFKVERWRYLTEASNGTIIFYEGPY